MEESNSDLLTSENRKDDTSQNPEIKYVELEEVDEPIKSVHERDI